MFDPELVLPLLITVLFASVIFQVIVKLNSELQVKDERIRELEDRLQNGQANEEQQGGAEKQSMVLYFTVQCPHCVSFKPVWKRFVSRNLDANVEFKEVDCNKEEANVNGVPTVMFYNSKSKSKSEFEYNGARTVQGLEQFLKQMLE